MQVYQNEEIPAFCQLFNGNLAIMNEEYKIADKWRMFELRGELEEESHLIEVNQVNALSLRSRTSFLFLNTSQNKLFIWHGMHSRDLQRDLINKCVEKFQNRHSTNLQVKELVEESAADLYLLDTNVFNGVSTDVNRAAVSNGEYQYTARLFLMNSLYGKFEVKEVLNPLRSENTCPYPFFQFNLYDVEQPGLFMIDNDREIYLWQGWYESNSDQNLKMHLKSQMDATDGSTKLRYNKNRRCAMETALKYWKSKHPDAEFKGHIVYAGLEPKEFTDLFPLWEVNENARQCNLNVSFDFFPVTSQVYLINDSF